MRFSSLIKPVRVAGDVKDARKPTSTAPCNVAPPPPLFSITISSPLSFDNVMVPSVFNTAVTSDTSLLINLTKSKFNFGS